MSATATVNSRTPAHSSAKPFAGLPAASRLLPRARAEDGDAEHPPIYMKLNPSILALLADSPAPPKISLEISDRSRSLRIGNYEYQGSLYKEPGYLEVYLPEEASAHAGTASDEPRFRSYGHVRNRMTIKQDKPLKIATDASDVDLEQPTERRIMNLLMLGPAHAADLAAKAQASRELVDAVLAQVAEPRGPKAQFVLKEAYLQKLESRPDTRAEARPEARPERIETQRAEGLPDSDIASDSTKQPPAAGPSKPRADDAPKPERITKTLKELREARAASKLASGSKSPAGSSSAGSSSAASSPGEDVLSPKGSAAGAKKTSPVPVEALEPEHTSAVLAKRKSAAAHTQSKRARSEATNDLPLHRQPSKEGDEDMFEIARKFKSAYGEYLELYSVLSKRKARPASQVEKLMAMHRQLERWKNTLWNNARNKRMVN